MNPAQVIIKKFGGQSALAALIGKGQSTVNHWAKTGIIPAKWRPIILKLAEENSINIDAEDFDTAQDVEIDIINETDEKLPRASHFGELPLNDVFLSAAVVDGQRIFSERSLATAFGIKGGGAYWNRKKTNIDSSAVLPEYLSANYLNSFITKELRTKLESAVDYISVSGMKSRGVDATILADICDVFVTAQKSLAESGIKHDNLEKVAKKAYDMIKAFASVGIIALVDEVTGYEKVREKNALQRFLEKFLMEEKGTYIELYPDDFFEAIFRMKGLTWKNINNGKKPQWMGHIINDVVYSRIAPKVLSILRERNPVVTSSNNKKYRKSKHTQFIEGNYGHEKLKEHLNMIIVLARASGFNWDLFKKLIDRALPKFNPDGSLSIELGFTDYEEM